MDRQSHRRLTVALVIASALSLLAGASGVAQAGSSGGSSTLLELRPVGSTHSDLGYVEYLPPSYRSGGSTSSPLLLFLHGYGESGAGTTDELPLLYSTGIPQLLAEDRWPGSRPFVVLAPQNPWETDDTIYGDCLAGEPRFLGSCLMRAQHNNGHPPDAAYCFTPNEVNGFVIYALRTYNVDPQRVYVTGLSCGGFAAWEFASQHPRRVAAMAPIAGEGRPATHAAGCRLARVPTWAFHGALDATVNPRGSTGPVRLMNRCANVADARATVYPDADHGDPIEPWSRTYDLSAGHNIYRWMLKYDTGS